MHTTADVTIGYDILDANRKLARKNRKNLDKFGITAFNIMGAIGSGKTLLSSYGAIHEMTLAAGQSFTIDTGHLVAFTAGMGFKVRVVGGIKSTLFSGEGLVVDMTGPGKVLLQTRSYDAFLSWLIPKIPRKSED